MSTIKVTNVNPPTAGNAVNINGLAYPTAGPLSSRNLIVNGAMAVAQRGTTSTDNGYGTVDRFRPGYGGGTQTQSQVAITSGDPYDEGFRYVLRLTNTATATGTGNSRAVAQRIEAQDVASCGWDYTSSSSYLTLSFWVRSSVAQEFYGYLLTDDGTSQIYPFSLGSLSAATWTKVTKTIPGNSNLQFDNNNNLGLEVVVAPFFGTDFTDSGVSVDTWAAYASGTRTPDYTNTWAGTTDATFDITGVQLEVGQVATPFEHRSYGDELARCQRYYQVVVEGEAGYTSVGTAAYYSSSNVRCNIPFVTEMRANPSVEIAASGTDTYLIYRAGAVDFASPPGASQESKYGIEVSFSTGVSGTAGHAGFIRTEVDSSCKIAAEAEL